MSCTRLEFDISFFCSFFILKGIETIKPKLNKHIICLGSLLLRAILIFSKQMILKKIWLKNLRILKHLLYKLISGGDFQWQTTIKTLTQKFQMQ